MTFKCSNPRLGVVDISTVTTIAPGPGNLPSVVLEPQLGEIVTGWDPFLGGGEFIYLKGVASLVAGDVVSYNAYTGVTTRWAGTANSGIPLAAAVATPTAAQYGWFQCGGNAIVTCSGTVAAGDSAFFSATAAVKTAAAAGKQVLNMVAASANGATIGTGASAVALAATQAVYTMQRPFCQGAIT